MRLLPDRIFLHAILFGRGFDKFLVLMLYETGMRIGECLGLRHEDIKSWDKTIHVVPRGDNANAAREGANKRGNSSRLTQSFHFFMFEPIFSPVNALNQPI